ncbi:hypothetical protein DSL72_007125 [Monilinia vaccinii-corymbosi]|uniref:Uncharacterized protein n=1 Tax=Monilinia vaccinii-corymbosi TaxID=61207 RepID=A0A8A3PM65_9HELO|nr:hypothetical protein DSL72_007125 [Monilinia vaccinii-corymbosi]
MRFFCTGRVVEWNAPQFQPLVLKMGKEHVVGARAVILLDVWKVQTSCGYGVPIITPLSIQMQDPSTGPWTDRETLGHFSAQKVGKSLMQTYQALNNSYSLDAIPGLKSARRQKFNDHMVLVKADEWFFWGKRIVKGEWKGLVVGLVVGCLIGVFFGAWAKDRGLSWGGVDGFVVEVRRMMGGSL